MNQHKLAAVVCGIPFSGTTYLSRMITSHPLIDSGFECGLLFGESPKEFSKKAPKFYKWMMSNEVPYNWKLSNQDLEEVCNETSFYSAYNKITEKCHLFKNEKCFILDKTPAYIYDLVKIMRKVPNTPFLIVHKNIFLQYFSYKKRGVRISEFIRLYNRYTSSLEKVSTLPLRKRLLILNFEDLAQYKGKSYVKLFKFLQLFNPEIIFNKDMFPKMIYQLEADINSNSKKLRGKYNFKKELEKCKGNISAHEIKLLEKIKDIKLN